MRYGSLLLRRFKSQQERERTLRSFDEWRELQRTLQAPRPQPRKLLIIRLDDIGDYVLFRNQLPMYKTSPRWRDHSITLLGNESWKDLFTTFDKESVDDTLWLDKREYLCSADYRMRTWRRLREQGFDTVIAPSRTRPLLLDDLCRLAAAPTLAIGAINSYVHSSWNQASDGLYQEMFAAPDARVHEFQFNGQFSAWICGTRYPGQRPKFDASFFRPGLDLLGPGPGLPILCFVGANTRSRRWPVKRWVEFIEYFRRYRTEMVTLAGSGSAELKIAAAIERETNAQNIAGKVSLLELLSRVAAAGAVLTNDTMAAHLAVSCDRPTVIIANGVNYHRFTDYCAAGMDNVVTLYPEVFSRKRHRAGELDYHYTDALTSDIATIRAKDVFEKLEQLLIAEQAACTRIRVAAQNLNETDTPTVRGVSV